MVASKELEKITVNHLNETDGTRIDMESLDGNNESDDAVEPSGSENDGHGIYNPVLACIPVVLLQFLVNMSRGGWTEPKLPSEYKEWLSYTQEIGLISGCILAVPMLEFLGRKCSLWLVSVSYFVIWSPLTVIGNAYYVFASWFLLELANGVNLVASAIYITEICPPSIRAAGGAALAISSFLGTYLGFQPTWKTSYTWTMIVKVMTAILVCSSFKLAVEPVYSAARWKGMKTRVKKNLLKLSPDRRNIDEELMAIQNYVNVEEEKRKSYNSLFDSENLKALFLAVNYNVLYATAAHYFVCTVPLGLIPSSSLTTLEASSGWFYTLHIAVLIVSCFTIEKISRRTLFRLFFGPLTFLNIYSTILLYMPVENRSKDSLYWVGNGLYTIAYAFIKPAAIIVASEILPQSIRAVGGAICIITQMASHFLAIRVLPMAEGFLVGYTILCAIMTAYNWRMLPETRGKPLYNINSRPWKGLASYFPHRFSAHI